MKTRPFSALLACVVAGLSTIPAGCGGGGQATLGPSTLRSQTADSLEKAFVVQRRSALPDDGTTRGGAIYDPFLELWGKPVADGVDYFTDEACTDAAGQARFVVDANVETFTVKTDITTAIDKGPWATHRSTAHFELSPTSLYFLEQGTNPELGTYSLYAGTVSTGIAFTVESTLPGAAKRVYKVLVFTDGRSQVVFDNENGHRYTLDFAANGSGTGTVTGSHPLLPANVTWDEHGTGKIVFQDGSELPFTHWRFNQF